ncbi:MAG: AMP-binding protein [Thiolinea sp.]
MSYQANTAAALPRPTGRHPQERSTYPHHTTATPALAATHGILTDPRHDQQVRWQPGERLHHLFEERCRRLEQAGYPAHLAVDSEHGRSWSYRQLDQRANQLARYLLAQGFHGGDRIGLLLDKGANSYLAMLAVLKIHAAYVPLDPQFPDERIAFISTDANLAGVLSISTYACQARAAGGQLLCLDQLAAELDPLPTASLSLSETGRPFSELCYIIYTSGSTGKPKGVPIEQASICHFVRVAADIYGYSAEDRVYQGLTLAFDFAVEEIWVPLSVGATLVPNQRGMPLLGEELGEFLQQQRISALCCVPTLLATLKPTCRRCVC